MYAWEEKISKSYPNVVQVEEQMKECTFVQRLELYPEGNGE